MVYDEAPSGMASVREYAGEFSRRQFTPSEAPGCLACQRESSTAQLSPPLTWIVSFVTFVSSW